jgi:predicted DNA-binding antitoxin AbrB/MazE fold protein
MERTITAIYENGVLRPLAPLDLPEHAQVEIDVRQTMPPTNTQVQRELVRAALSAAGLLSSHPPIELPHGVHPLTEQERAELADRLGKFSGTPLSEIIIEEREER